jgi:hypothetical protein
MQQAHYLAPSHSLRNSHPTGPARGIVVPQGTFWVEALAGHNREIQENTIRELHAITESAFQEAFQQ